jgi:hypothetical protein
MDVAATGTWNCKLLVDPNDENAVHRRGRLEGVTWPRRASHAGALHARRAVLVHQAAGYASISQIGIHTDGAEQKI